MGIRGDVVIVLVTGGRGYADVLTVERVLRNLAPGLVLHGGARGADTIADHWASRNGVHTAEVCALWDFHGKAAGPKRNAVLVELAKRLGAEVVAFPGGAGTADCVRRAREAGLVIHEVT